MEYDYENIDGIGEGDILKQLKYFSLLSNQPGTADKNLNILMLDGDSIYRWSIYHEGWFTTAMNRRMMYDSSDPRIVELDLNIKYQFISVENQQKWEQIMLTNSELGKEIL